MSLTLTYDATLSRVRIAASWPALVDTFTRTVSAGWGATDTGQTWTSAGGAAGDYSTNGTQGRMSAGDTNVERRMLLSAGGVDQQVRAWGTVPVNPTGAAINWGALLRWQDASNYYWVDVQVPIGGGALTLRLVKRVANVATQVASVTTAVTHSTTVPRVLKAQVIGSTVRARLWSSDGVEPTTWQLETTDGSLTSGTQVGVVSRLTSENTNTLPVVVSFDNVRVDQPSPVVVQRSTDQVRWSTVRGGAAVTVAGDAVSLDDYEFVADVPNYYRVAGEVASITPTLGGVWLKSVARPFLNRRVVVQDYGDVERPARAGVFDVIGRSSPVAVSDVRGSRRWNLTVLTSTPPSAGDIDMLLASGDPLFIHVPAGCDVPGGYVSVGDTVQRRPARRSVRRLFELPCVEVAAPGPDVVGATSNWQTVLNTYGTWADLLAAHPTWADLLELIGDPTDVVVP